MRAVRWLKAAGPVAVAAVAVLVAAGSAYAGPVSVKPAVPHAAPAAGSYPPSPQDWPAYLDGPSHWSYNSADKAITRAEVPELTNKWHFGTGQEFLASPTVADGSVFIGSPDGTFYKLNEVTGHIQARYYIGQQSPPGCEPWGVIDTATVAADPVTHQQMVYVGGPDGYLYALTEANLTLKWKSVVALPTPGKHTYFDWSSPTVSHGNIYIGVSSYCNVPFIRGAVIGYNQSTGQKAGEFYTVPAGHVGASIWSSVAVSPSGYVYASSGNGPDSDPTLGYSESIIKLTPATLNLADSFQVPADQVTTDGDFGASPSYFGNFVGACNKNGIFYALISSTMTVAWQARIGAASDAVPHANCLATPVYNGKDLFFAGPEVTINGRVYRGSVQERNAATGALIWETGLPNGVIGSPTMNGAGVLAVGTFDYTNSANYTYLINAATGKIIRTLVRGMDFAQSVWADGWLFTANSDGVYAWGPKGKSNRPTNVPRLRAGR
jgi:outer membrane protein assembly factor BamB